MKTIRLFQFVLAVTTAFVSMNCNPVYASASEKPKVVLLVSLDPALYPRGVAAWFHNYRNYPQKLEATFRGAFQNSAYDLEVIQNASVYDLYQVLHASDTAGVFWVSHEAPISWSTIPGVQIDPLLVDHNRADVKSAFKEINSNIRWVSIVACESSVVINWLKSQSQDQSSIQIQGFDTPIDARKGLNQAIYLSNAVLNTPAPAPAPCVSKLGVPVTLTRTVSAKDATDAVFFPAVTIEKSGNILGAFPEANLQAGETQIQEQVIYLSSFDDLQITLQSGFDPAVTPDNFEMGLFEAKANWAGAAWKTFAKPDGTPFGVTAQILMYTGQTPGAMPIQAYQAYSCQ